jgi:hypothetical protein
MLTTTRTIVGFSFLPILGKQSPTSGHLLLIVLHPLAFFLFGCSFSSPLGVWHSACTIPFFSDGLSRRCHCAASGGPSLLFTPEDKDPCANKWLTGTINGAK